MSDTDTDIEYDLVPVEPTEVVVTSEDHRKYGVYITTSSVCPVCSKPNHMEINLMRARDHMSYDDIANKITTRGVNPGTLKTHFKNHYLIDTTQQKLIDLHEDGSPETLEIIKKVFEGDIDIFSASMAILQSKGKRLSSVNQRLEFLNAHLEIDSVDEIDKQEFIQLNRVAADIENSMVKVYEVIDKKLFPTSKTELSNAILQYKINVYAKIIDMIQLCLLEVEQNPEFTETIQKVRLLLVEKLGKVEEGILQSGGFFKAD